MARLFWSKSMRAEYLREMDLNDKIHPILYQLLHLKHLSTCVVKGEQKQWLLHIPFVELFSQKICTIQHNLQPRGIYHNYTLTAPSDTLHTFRSQIYWFVIKDWTEVKWYFRFSLPTKSQSLITLTLYLWADFYKYFSDILANNNVFINILNCFHPKVVGAQKEFRKQTLTWFHRRWWVLKTADRLSLVRS